MTLKHIYSQNKNSNQYGVSAELRSKQTKCSRLETQTQYATS